MSKVLEVFASPGNGFLLFRTVDVVEVGAHTVVAVAISLKEAVLIAVTAGEGDVRQAQAADCFAAARRHARQATSFHSGHGIEVLAETGKRVGVGLVGLVQLVDRLVVQRASYLRGKSVALGNVAEDLPKCRGAPAAAPRGGIVSSPS